jgi:hypothetical protein
MIIEDDDDSSEDELNASPPLKMDTREVVLMEGELNEDTNATLFKCRILKQLKEYGSITIRNTSIESGASVANDKEDAAKNVIHTSPISPIEEHNSNIRVTISTADETPIPTSHVTIGTANETPTPTAQVQAKDDKEIDLLSSPSEKAGNSAISQVLSRFKAASPVQDTPSCSVTKQPTPSYPIFQKTQPQAPLPKTKPILSKARFVPTSPPATPQPSTSSNRARFVPSCPPVPPQTSTNSDTNEIIELSPDED